MPLDHPTPIPGSMADIAECLRAASVNPTVAELRKALGDRLFLVGRFDAALANYRKARELNPNIADLALWLDRAEAAGRGSPADELAAHQREMAEQRAKLFESAREAIADTRDYQRCFATWQALILADPCMFRTLDTCITKALDAGDLQLAARYAHVNAGLRLGSRWYPLRRPAGAIVPTFRGAAAMLTVGKLEHDVAQFAYLCQRGLLDEEIANALPFYHQAIERLKVLGPDAGVPLSAADERQIGALYNQITYIHEAPRLKAALSDYWDRQAVQRDYREDPLGVVVIDNFLSQAALEGLRTFCCASTIWTANVYAQGRLGSFFRTGFNCPLLIQVAEELRAALPDLLDAEHPLRQLWGFKYPPSLTADTIHADFASVNVNFWITPETGNLGEQTGGLIMYDREAPAEWDFEVYNKRPDLIRSFLRAEGARAIRIPYRENRAIIFNSELFHETAPLQFRPEYENRRINVTLLYGDRGIGH